MSPIASNHAYDLPYLLRRPPYLRPATDTGLVPLASFAAERMAAARQLLFPFEPPDACQRRLLRFWGDVGFAVHRLGLFAYICPILDVLRPCPTYGAIGYWMTGKWHDDDQAMRMIMWLLQLSPAVVTGAYDLHYRARYGVESQEPDESTWNSGDIPLAYLC